MRQLGVDRILDFTFSDGLFHLFLEFYAGGNIVLTDADLTIQAVLRIVSAGEDGRGECKIGAKYDVSGKEPPGPVTKERIVAALEAAVAVPAGPQPEAEGVPKKKYQKKKKKGDDALRRVLGSKLSEFPPALIESSLCTVGLDPNSKTEDVLASEEKVGMVLAAFKEAEKTIASILQGETAKGYIIARQPGDAVKGKEAEARPGKKTVSFGNAEAVESTGAEPQEKVQEVGEAKGLVFDDFHPFCPQQSKSTPGVKVLEYEGFNKTVDTFFSSIESQKLEGRLKEREATAAKRLEAARTDHKKRVEGLRSVQELNIRKAQAIEANLDRVEEAIGAVNSLVAQAMDWVAMERLIEGEKKRGNSVAEIVHLPLKLFENTITLKLREADWDDNDSGYDETDDEDSEDEQQPEQAVLTIDVDLSLSAYANARIYYDQKRSAAAKETKTLAASAEGLKSAEKKITADLQRTLKTEKKVLQPVRKPLWFEKFLYFLSSDGYLVLGGRDLQQNEHIYKRHFRRGDVYLHADIQRAATVIVKNNPATPNAPIPPSTLQQAGTLSVATSKAWDSKAVMSAWWVNFDQVSKTGPTGEYLGIGSFIIKGKKNYLPPAQLILGYGVMWRVDEESKKRHVKHRVDETLDEEGKVLEETPVEETAKEPNDENRQDTEESLSEDSDEEEFPDTKIESEGEEEVVGNEEEEEFPDSKIVEPEAKPEPENVDQESPSAVENKDTMADESEPDEGAGTPSSLSTTALSSRRHLSAKQRRELKKYGRLLDTPTSPSVASSADPTRASTPSQDKDKPKAAPLPRGKRGKQKKAAQKYAFQDEEDRALALSLLGSTAAPGATPEPEAAAGTTPKETPEERKARLREQHKKAQAVGLAEEAKRHAAVAAAGGTEEDEEEDHEIATTPLDALIPDPRDDDVLLDAIPVCAPWGAMGRYKYRIKMQPGAQKKGKAIQEVWNGWVADKKGTMRGKEKELVGAWRESDLINCVGVSKIRTFGGSGGGDGGKGKGKSGGGGKGGGKGGKKK